MAPDHSSNTAASHCSRPSWLSVRRSTSASRSPTDDLEEIKKAIHDIPVDESGIELTFTAVAEAARKYQKFRTGNPRRNVMLIVVTDEAGNDEDRQEAAIDICKRYAMPVYVIGVPAPFGQRQAFVHYVDPDPKYAASDLPVDQGPESAMPENVQLGFSGRDFDPRVAIDSGFGPYGLTRLCVATHGIYFAVHPNRPTGAGKVKGTADMARGSASSSIRRSCVRTCLITSLRGNTNNC